jgi:hypothetical protein
MGPSCISRKRRAMMGDHEPVPPTGQPRTRRRRFAELAIALVVAAIAVLLVSRLIDYPPIGFQGRTFHDALGLFSATVPDGWKVTGGTNDGIEGERDGVPLTTEAYSFVDQHKGDSSAGVGILVTALTTPQLRAMMCQPVHYPIVRFIDGIPVGQGLGSMEGGDPGPNYEFDSGNADFQISVSLPTAPLFTYFEGTAFPEAIPTVTDPGSANSGVQDVLNSISVADHALC